MVKKLEVAPSEPNSRSWNETSAKQSLPYPLASSGGYIQDHGADESSIQ